MGILNSRKGIPSPFWRDQDNLLPVQHNIISYLKKTGAVDINLTDLAEKLGWDRRTVSLRILELEINGIVKITRHKDVWGPEGCNSYELC